MTNRRKRWLIGVSALALAATLATPAVHWRLIGWARGEAFYRGRPTTFWMEEVMAVESFGGCVGPPLFRRKVEPLATLQGLVNLPITFRDVPVEDVQCFYDDPAAIQVLRALLAAREPKVRTDAANYLGYQQSREAVPELKALLADKGEDTKVRTAAYHALWLIGVTDTYPGSE